MHVFLTGATGLVGAHSALALLDAGHSLHLLVRDRETASQYFRSRGYVDFELQVADMRDVTAIAAGMKGCDAVLHAAALVSLDPRQAQVIYSGNMAGTDAVVGTACRLGIANIVHVSSLGALFRPGADIIDENSPLGEPREAYTRSKRDADAQVRQWQEQGHPVQITYPGGVFGPHDPKLSESNRALVTFMTSIVPNTSTGIQCVDVRDVAAIHRYLIENQPVADPVEARFIVGGHYLPWSEFHQLLQGLTGRRILHPRINPRVFRFFGAVADAMKRVYPFQFPVGSESTSLVTQWVPADSSGTLRNAAGYQLFPVEQTFEDTLRWLVDSGHLQPRYAGQLLP